jgi:hypothetical protein
MPSGADRRQSSSRKGKSGKTADRSGGAGTAAGSGSGKGTGSMKKSAGTGKGKSEAVEIKQNNGAGKDINGKRGKQSKTPPENSKNVDTTAMQAKKSSGAGAGDNSVSVVESFLGIAGKKSETRRTQLPVHAPQDGSDQLKLPSLQDADDTGLIKPDAEAGKRLIAVVRNEEANSKVSRRDQVKSSLKADELLREKPHSPHKTYPRPPPVKYIVNASFVPYKVGRVIHLDTNLLPVGAAGDRIICLNSGSSVYLSVAKDEVGLGGLYIKGKFKVTAIVNKSFSGKVIPVAVLERVK